MKKITRYALLLLGLLIIQPTFARTKETDPTTSINHSNETSSDAKVLLNRLNQIREMDKSNLTHTEKRALRKEVKTIKATLKATHSGIYLSVGAIIIIILLLILIL